MMLLFVSITLCLVSLIAAQDTDCPPGEVIIEGSCGKCPPGYIYFDEFQECTVCHMNYFKPGEGQDGCIPCPPGSFSLLASAECTKCPKGQALMQNGKCGTCPPGKTYIEYDQVYRDCERGYFKAEEGVGKCLECLPNTFSLTGASKCKTCPDGQRLLRRGKCGRCPPGTYFNNFDLHDASCIRCDKNTFQPFENVRTYCRACAGDTNSLRGATKCTKCPANQDIMNDGTCGSCPPGSFYHREKVVARNVLAIRSNLTWP